MSYLSRWVIRCVAIAAIAAGGQAHALSYTMPTDQSLLEQSQGVALVEVGAASASPERGETRYRVRIVRELAGKILGREQTLVLPGYWTKDGGLRYAGVPSLPVDQRMLLFYMQRGDGDLQATQLTLGMFFPVPDKHGDVYRRVLDDSTDLGRGKNARFALPRAADAFEHWIVRRAAGVAAPENYLRADATDAAKFNLIRINFNNPNFPIGNGRWAQFEQGTTMRWYAPAGGQQNMVRNEFEQLAAGLAGWVDDPGSLVLMSYAGTGSSTEARDANVSWNDPQNVIPGDYDCSPGGGGILGAGGSSATSQQHTYNGVQWYGLLRGTLVTQPSAGCFFDDDDGRSGIEFFVHEVGHTLGFAHSCGSDVPTSCGSNPTADAATMRASLHADGRGATLAADDVAAVRFVYEDASAPVPMADLSLGMTATPSPVPRGGMLTFTITVENDGPDQATALQMVQTLPAGVTVLNASGSGWTCATGGATVSCTRGVLNSGTTSAIVVTVNVPIDYTGAGALASQASIDSEIDDPQGGNNSDSVSVPVDFIVDRIFGNSFE
ncbi:DUF11 domain-containing protein [Chiayiivirga flava]|uniref:Putative repeat protein (TIGR01451 family) n=1 Tax=Chiayiivirga flava TaxID=659595 RepID=A0A7W8D5R1_9GAMM|nr:DUF11 domain-containing protein [Chiayiivirga flava]MBB5208424.1 putative repeat protein (TIGR01451 family) [Chiayiivirga flava]